MMSPKTHPNRAAPEPDELGGAEADRLRRTSLAIRVGGSLVRTVHREISLRGEQKVVDFLVR